MKMETFTLYFLGYDHSGGKATEEEKKDSRFNREGRSVHIMPGSGIPSDIIGI